MVKLITQIENRNFMDEQNASLADTGKRRTPRKLMEFAAEISNNNLEDNNDKVQKLREAFLEKFSSNVSNFKINGDLERFLPVSSKICPSPTNPKSNPL